MTTNDWLDLLGIVLPIVLFLLGIPRDPWKKQKLDK